MLPEMIRSRLPFDKSSVSRAFGNRYLEGRYRCNNCIDVAVQKISSSSRHLLHPLVS